jgi:hypothetical protein
LTDLSREKLAVALVVICAALLAIAALYVLITVVFTEINPVAAVAAISVAIFGFAWFKKEACLNKSKR